MKLAALYHRLRWLNVPGALLLALLQRTPVVRVAAVAEEFLVASPLGSVLRSAAAVAGSLGALHSMAGATVLSASTASPLSATVGTAIPTVAMTVTGAQSIPGSFNVTGPIPPGLSISGLTGAGGAVNTATLIMSGTPTTAGAYRLTIRAWADPNLRGDSSSNFTYTINVGGGVTVAPAITTQPVSQTVNAGVNVTFTAAASGTPAPTFQWNKNGAPISGATSATLVISAASATDAGSYTVTVSNGVGSPVTSSAATVTVTPPATQGTAPSITQAPQSQTVLTGATVAFNVSATGSPAPTFQWRKDGVVLAGQTKPSLILTNVTAANAGSYTVVATNGVGTPATSTAATLALTSATNFGHLTNLAIFATLSSAVPDFTVATVIGGGGGTKPFLVRAVGPSLGQLGVGGFVADTNIDLFAGSTAAGSNNDWGGTAALSNAFASVGAFAYAGPATKDSAIFLPTAASGSYSVKVSGVGGATGLVLAELYDATPTASFGPTTSRFLNVSVLKQIQSNESLTVGFNLAGTTSRTVLIRAVGPALGAFGVGGTMPDPQLDLFSGQTVLASNDNWGGDPQVNAAFSAVGAFVISDPASKDAVIIATLAPGNYTAVVKGVNGSAGLTLVEVYDVP